METSGDARQVGPRAARGTGLPPLENDAEAYDVTVEEAQVEPGTRYWRVRRVHHLDRDENKGRHHIFIDALTADGRRALNSQARVTWKGGQHTVPIDKPLDEPGGNFPLWKWQVCSLEMLGMPSDRVHNLRTDHPDEPYPDGRQSGNTLFHHSFLVEFQQVTAPGTTTGAIEGRVENNREGLAVELSREGTPVNQAAVTTEGRFRFEDVEEGVYQLALDGRSQTVAVKPGETSEVVFRLAPHDSIIEGKVRNGGGLLLRLVREGEVMAEGALGQSGAFRLRNLGPGVYFVQVLRPNATEPLVRSSPITVDGTSRERIELIAESGGEGDAGSPLAHYVLFGHPDSATTRAQLTVLLPVLAAKRLAFGFDFHEAAHASRVTVIGDGSAVPEDQMIYVASRGVKVERITGTPQEILEKMQ